MVMVQVSIPVPKFSQWKVNINWVLEIQWCASVLHIGSCLNWAFYSWTFGLSPDFFFWTSQIKISLGLLLSFGRCCCCELHKYCIDNYFGCLMHVLLRLKAFNIIFYRIFIPQIVEYAASTTTVKQSFSTGITFFDWLIFNIVIVQCLNWKAIAITR